MSTERTCYAGRVKVLEDVSLAAHTTLGLGGAARYWTELSTEEDVPAALAWAEQRGLAVLVLGSGSNVVVADAGWSGLVLHMHLRGVQELAPGQVRAAAGEDWDTFVAARVERGWAGIECLSGIPGRVGATPAQNVGAYGQEVSETIARVRAWDRRARQWVELAADECGFGYRRSRFNGADRGRFLITAVEFHLRPDGPPTLRYPELQRHVSASATLSEVRAAVLELRRSKAMVIEAGEPDCRSAGSFFKNPVLTAAAAAALAARADGAAPPQFAAPDGGVKIPAAWLIEHAGFAKGFRLPGSGIHLSTKHVLALVNDGTGSAAQALALARYIRDGVEARWGVRLEPEPLLIGFTASL